MREKKAPPFLRCANNQYFGFINTLRFPRLMAKLTTISLHCLITASAKSSPSPRKKMRTGTTLCVIINYIALRHFCLLSWKTNSPQHSSIPIIREWIWWEIGVCVCGVVYSENVSCLLSLSSRVFPSSSSSLLCPECFDPNGPPPTHTQRTPDSLLLLSFPNLLCCQKAINVEGVLV